MDALPLGFPDSLHAPLRALFPWLAVATWVLVPLYARVQRGRSFAIFSAVVMGFALAGAGLVHARLPGWVPARWLPLVDVAFTAGLLASALHYAHLVRARLRGRAFRWLVSIPGQSFVAASFMAVFWLLALSLLRLPLWGLGQETALAWLAPLDLAPYLVGAVAMFTSARLVPEVVRVTLGGEGPAVFSRVPVERHRRRPPAPHPERPLRLVQIADPHIGAWQPVSRLRRLIEELVDRDPDLVLLTGDFLTMESNADAGALSQALSPLLRLPGRCFAIFGNHDHEAPEVVRESLLASGVVLLVDDSRLAETAFGPVQILGADYVSRDREAHLRDLMERHPRVDGVPRILLLHDPSAFHDLPDDEVDFVLSGHTHGGQVGLVSLGLDWTVLARSRWPDHGLFARRSTHLYVHRGTGFYGFPLRVGVPGEASLMELVWR